MKESGYCFHPFISINRISILLNSHNIIKETKSYLSIKEYGIKYIIRTFQLRTACYFNPSCLFPYYLYFYLTLIKLYQKICQYVCKLYIKYQQTINRRSIKLYKRGADGKGES